MGIVQVTILLVLAMAAGAGCWQWGYSYGVEDRFGLLPRIKRNHTLDNTTQERYN